MSVLLVHTACIETPTGERIMQFAKNWFSLRYTGITNMDQSVQSEISFDLDYVDCKISASFVNEKGRHTGQKTTWVLCDPSGDGKQAEIKGSHGTSIAKLSYSTEGWWPCESPRRHKQILMILTRSLVIPSLHHVLRYQGPTGLRRCSGDRHVLPLGTFLDVSPEHLLS
jgi:hypothetical protein